MMIGVLARNWWALALRGLFAVLFSISAFVWPGMALAFLIALFGIYALLDGILALVAGYWAAEAHLRWWPLVLSGLAGIAVGVDLSPARRHGARAAVLHRLLGHPHRGHGHHRGRQVEA